MKKAGTIPLYATLALLLGGCSTLEVMTKQDKSVDMSHYQTFNFDKHKGGESDPVYFSEIEQRRVKDAIAEELTARGYRRAQHPDLLIGLYLKVENKTQIVSVPHYYGGPAYYGHYWGYDVGWNSVHSVDWTFGTLVIDLVDTQQDRLVWQGIAQDLIPDKPRGDGEQIKTVIKAVFKDFPVQREFQEKEASK